MCGIVGLVFTDPDRPADRAALGAMNDAIAHRGPDDSGCFAEAGVALGMRRLSIIDLGGSRQPIRDETGDLVLVFNGEVYNYRDLRRGLATRGHRFATAGDAETIVHLYQERGPRCVEALRGMFAFALWERSSRTLLLVRDRFGIKPLYWSAGPWGLAFASELKGLLASGRVDRALDLDALDAYLELGYVPAPMAAFRGVRKLEPGHLLRWSPATGAVTEPYWDLPTETRRPPPDVGVRVREWLDDSVTAHLVSDVPVAAFLSGGLDSSAVVASAAVRGTRTDAFTARYEGSGSAAADETGLAERLTRRYGVPLTQVPVRPQVRDLLEPIAWALDEPHADDSALPTWILSRAIAASHKVALAGIGGDELFAGYRRHHAMRLGALYDLAPAGVRRLVRRAAWRLPDGNGLGTDRLKRFVRDQNGSPAQRFLRFLSRADTEQRRALYVPELRARATAGAATRFAALAAHAPTRDGLTTALYLDFKTFLPDDVLALSDRIAMAHGLEVRVPFVDHELVERVFRLPSGSKAGLWSPKRLLRRAVASRLPAGHLRAPKRGFVGPTGAWLRGELRSVVRDELSEDRMRRLGLFDPAAVTRLLEEHETRRHNREALLWSLLSFSVWHRLYVET